jgi:hypothetical protein
MHPLHFSARSDTRKPDLDYSHLQAHQYEFSTLILDMFLLRLANSKTSDPRPPTKPLRLRLLPWNIVTFDHPTQCPLPNSQ